MCLQCFIFKNNQNGCIQCKNSVEIKEEEEKEKDLTSNDDFNDFDQNELFDEWDENPSSNNTELLQSIYDEETEENDTDDEQTLDQQPSTYKVQWLADIKDDAAEFSGDHMYPHTKTLFEVFGNIFGLKQVEIMRVFFLSSKTKH